MARRFIAVVFGLVGDRRDLLRDVIRGDGKPLVMKYLRMTVPLEVVTPTSTVTEGHLLNVQLLPDGTMLELDSVVQNPTSS